MEKIMEEFKQLENGRSQTSTGFKRLAFDPITLNLMPVLYRVYSGYLPDRGTVQAVKDGSIVCSVEWNSKGPEYFLYRYGEKTCSVGDQARYWIDLKDKHPWMSDWLEPSPRSETLIPLEIIPESEYLSIKVKNGRITNWSNRFGLSNSFNLELLMKTKAKDLCLAPIMLDFDPDKYCSTELHHIGELVNIHESEEWVGSNGDGKEAKTLEFKPTVEHRSNYPYQEDYTELGKPGIEGWNKFKFLIKISYGIYTKDHMSNGIGVNTWQTKFSW